MCKHGEWNEAHRATNIELMQNAVAHLSPPMERPAEPPPFINDSELNFTRTHPLEYCLTCGRTEWTPGFYTSITVRGAIFLFIVQVFY